MINIETIEVSGFEGAIKGMRNPFKNREKSDSGWGLTMDVADDLYRYIIGPKDLELCQKLLRAGGDDDSKFMRYIHVQVDVNAPLYWWKEMDTYKVSTVANSESTMHTIMKREITMDDFSWETLDNNTLHVCFGEQMTQQEWAKMTLDLLNHTRERYVRAVERKDPQVQLIWKQLIQMLPSSYMQKRTVDLNYQTLRRIFFARRNHKLSEWSGENGFCGWIKTLPYAEELITYELNNKKRDFIIAESIRDFETSSYKVTDPDRKLYFDEEHGFNKSELMSEVSRLITNMTIKGADPKEITDVVKFSMVLIDAQKLNLDWLKAFDDFKVLSYDQKYGGNV